MTIHVIWECGRSEFDGMEVTLQTMLELELCYEKDNEKGKYKAMLRTNDSFFNITRIFQSISS